MSDWVKGISFVHSEDFLLYIDQHVLNWPKDLPLCVHAEGKTTAAILLLAELSKRPVHVCHVARKEEVCIKIVSTVVITRKNPQKEWN